MKKRFAIVTVLLLALLLSACGGKAAPTKEELEATITGTSKIIVKNPDSGNKDFETELEGNVYKIHVYNTNAVLFKETYEKTGDSRGLDGWKLIKENAGLAVDTCSRCFEKAGYDKIKIEYTIYGKPLSSVSLDKMDDVLYKYSDGKVVYDWNK